MTNSINDVLDFWYAPETSKKWFNSTPRFDAEIKQRFESLWESAANGDLKQWENSAEGCLALSIVLDQFPLNMFRGENKSFSTEQQAIGLAKTALAKGFDNELESQRVSFLYLPLMHSEKLLDQHLCVASFAKHDLPDNLRFAKHHRDIILEFGRFPHRNEILGRESTDAEVAYLQSKRAFKG